MNISPISLQFFSLFVIICCMTSQHKRTFSNSLFCCSLLPTLRSKFPHFLCTVCKIVVCSQHSFQFKKFNSQSASVLTAADLHSEFPQQILKCIAQCCKILFHYQIRKIIKFLEYLIVCGNEISHLTDTQVLLL